MDYLNTICFCSEIPERFLTFYIVTMLNINDGEHMKINQKTKKASIFAGILSIVVISIFAMSVIGFFEPSKAEPQRPENHLFVEEIYLLKTGETNKTVNVTCTPYLTNIWDQESGEIKIIAYVVKESNNVADCKNTVEIGKIAADSTAELEVPIVLSGDTYRVDMLIFEDGKLVLKGSLTLKATSRIITTYGDGDDVNKSAPYVSWDIECEGTADDFYRVSHN